MILHFNMLYILLHDPSVCVCVCVCVCPCTVKRRSRAGFTIFYKFLFFIYFIMYVWLCSFMYGMLIYYAHNQFCIHIFPTCTHVYSTQK